MKSGKQISIVILVLGALATSQSIFAKKVCQLKKKSCHIIKKEAQQNIRQVLSRYETALNGNDVSTILKLYTQDAVFMPQHSSPKVGKRAVRSAYQKVFKTIDLNVSFKINEIKLIGYHWAYVRTTSTGSITVLANKTNSKENNQELFLLQKQPDGQWKIARYIFSTTNARH